MAAHQIGNFKWKISKDGFQYKIGDGEVKTLFGPKHESAQPEYDNYRGEDSDYQYDDGYTDANGYYEELPPEVEGEDGYYYNEPQNANEDDASYEDVDGASRVDRIMDYVDNNPWVLYVLLVVLPPLGIYLLWHFGYFEDKLRWIVSAVSGIWFVIMLIIIFSIVFGGGEDIPTTPNMTLTSIRPATLEPTQEPTAEPTDELSATVDASVEPSATPITGGSIGSSGNEAQAGYVYSPQTGLYYHTSESCTKIDANVSVTLVTIEAAQKRNQSACPLCSGGTVYYATPGGSRYHTDRTCDGMQNAVEYSKEAAEKESKVACHICAGGVAPTEDTKTSSGSKYVASLTNDKSGYKVWMTTGGSAYHATSDCRGMSGATQVTLLKALQSGKPACSKCLSYLNSYVYCTSGGTYYHSASTTCGMKNGTRVTLSLSLVLGKKKCPDCIDEKIYSNNEEDKQTSSSSSSSSGVMVYGTENGDYYHTDPTCGGMKNAARVTLKQALQIDRPACPVCCPSAEKTVYASDNSKYYHSYAGCSNMKNPVSGTLAQALTYNLTACPKCWNSNGTANKDAQKEDAEDGNSGYSGIFVYASENGSTYHANKNCSKAPSDANRVLLEQAIDDGKDPCTRCADYADDTVYGVSGNKYFHKNSSCSGIVGAKKGTVAEALLLGLEVCPICFDDNDFVTEEGNTAVSTNQYKSGKSGIKVYASYADDYYHMNTLCTRFKGDPLQITLETGLNNDKSACPTCASSANRTVYGTLDGKYYHYSSSCAGSDAVSAHLDVALANGFKACPNCVTNNSVADNEDEPKYKEGTSGIKVYAVASGSHYHTDSTCSGMNDALFVSLEKALNYGYEPCANCAALGGRKVYGFGGSPYYHINRDCEDRDYVSGTLDQALANGYTACPICINNDGEGNGNTGSSNSTGNNGNESYKAPANSEVYVDLTGDSSAFLYHSGKKCSDTGMTSGTMVTLEYAIEHGYSDCGHCNPPIGIE